jgi:excisionase family DNA binding protein
MPETQPDPFAVLYEPAPTDLFTTDEACRVLKSDERQVRRWRASGELPYVRLGHRTIRFRRQDLERFIADRAVDGALQHTNGADPA